MSQVSGLDTVLGALKTEFAARAAKHDREGSFAFENFARLHELGLLSLTVPVASGGGVPKAFGGGEGTLARAAQVVRAVAGGDPSTALVLIMQYIFQTSIAGSKAWPEHLRRRVNRDAVESGALINALRVEPETWHARTRRPAQYDCPQNRGRVASLRT